ncbi:hypothetical protein McaMca56_005232 [Microsporum canis]
MAIKARFHEDVSYAPKGRDEILDLRQRRGRFSSPLDGIRGERHSRRQRRGNDEEIEEEIEIDIERDRHAGQHRTLKHHSHPRGSLGSPSRVVESDELVIRRDESPGWKRVERNDLFVGLERGSDVSSEDSFETELVPVRHRPSHSHEEIIGYHKHGRRGHAPLHRRATPKRVDIEEIEMRRHHRDHEDETILEVDVDIHKESDDRHHRGRKHDPLVMRPRELIPSHIREEDEQHGNYIPGRLSMDEVCRNTSADWHILDAPPETRPAGTDRLGVCEETSWSKRNRIRRSSYLPDTYDGEVHGTVAKRYVGVKEKREELWTEITKDLVVKEAIEMAGYEYEETVDFFYIFSNLQYDDVAELVKFSEEYRQRRRERVLEIQREGAMTQPLPLPLPQPRMILEKGTSRATWDEERVHETEILIDESRKSRRRSPILRERIV